MCGLSSGMPMKSIARKMEVSEETTQVSRPHWQLVSRQPHRRDDAL